jgi:hypothetical protein
LHPEKFLWIAHGTKDDIDKAKQILGVTKAHEVAIFSQQQYGGRCQINQNFVKAPL